MSADFDEQMMSRAIGLARAQLGRTRSNPAVGCILVKDGKVLAQAATAPGGRPHAEEQALEAAGSMALGAVAYVTLEPCARRTSGACSCAQRLADARVARVVYACDNPDPLSAGEGPKVMKAAGLAVEAGLLGEEANALLYRGFRRRAMAARNKLGAR